MFLDWIIAFLGFAILGIIIILLLYQVILILVRTTLFYPVKEHTWKPEESSYEEVKFGSPRLNGWLFKNYDSKKIVLFCHGNTGNISHREYVIQIARMINVSLFIFDYQGYGLSLGSPNILNLISDGQSAYDYLISIGYRPDQIIVWGESIGGHVATSIAADNEVDTLLLMATFSDLSDLLRESSSPIGKVGAMLLHMLYGDRSSNSKKIKRVTAPTLIIHSYDDEIIPYKHGVELYENIYSDKKEFISIKGGHGTPQLNKQIVERIIDFCELEATLDSRCLDILEYISSNKVKHGL